MYVTYHYCQSTRRSYLLIFSYKGISALYLLYEIFQLLIKNPEIQSILKLDRVELFKFTYDGKCEFWIHNKKQADIRNFLLLK